MNSVCEEVRTSLLGRVEILDLEVSLADKVVVNHDNSCNRGQEDGVGRKIGGELVSVFE